MELKHNISALAEESWARIVEVRRHLHQHPELSFQEKETAEYIARFLESEGFEIEKGIGGYGIVAVLKGDKSGKCLGLRADMDALPIQEMNEVPYRSKHAGVMHACGHDVHTSSLLGTALLLKALRSEIAGSVKFIFQPGEEVLPGGASLMIRDGVLENPQVDFMLGQHVFPELEVGHFGVCSGPYMASTDELYITVKGKGGHGAMPHLAIDPIHASAQLIVQAQALVSRLTNPIEPSVFTIGKIASEGGATNIIPEKVELHGTFRALNEQVRASFHEALERLVQGLELSMGISIDLEIRKGYPALVNDELLSDEVLKFGKEYIGTDNFQVLPKRMTAEDFAYFAQTVPACFYRLGVANQTKGIQSGLHTNTFDIDEDALKHGMGMMAYIAINLLNME